MRKRKWLSALLVVLSGSVVYASVDLTDFDEDLMRNMDDAVKTLDTSIGSKDAQAVAADAQFIADGLKWSEGYFTRKGNAEDAVKLAAQGHGLAAAIATASSQNDFDAASTAYRSLVKTCRTCHDAYKPPEL
jgi:cytochrome c556